MFVFMNDGPRVLVVGGLDRLERALEAIGVELGLVLEAHHGDVRGRGARELEGKIGRADVVVVFTSVVSHGAMWLAKKHARALGKTLHVVRGGGLAAARDILDAVRDARPVARATHAA
jgi:hypothetical protein